MLILNAAARPVRGPWPILLIGTTIAIAIGCGGRTDGPSGETARDGDRPEVALVMKSLANEFFKTMADGAEQHHAEHADEYDLIVNGIKDERDVSRQVKLVEEMIVRGVDALVIAPADSKALVPVLRRAKDAGVAVVNIDNRLDAEVLEQSGLEVPFVGPDNRAGARLVGLHLAEQLGEGAPVAIIEGLPTADNARQRKQGFEEAIEEGGLKLVASQTGQWETGIGNRVAAAILAEHPELRGFLCANDSMALGALAAVKAAGRGEEVLIVGYDNISAVREAIKAGEILATVDQHADQLAVYGIEYALQSLDEPAPPSPTESSAAEDRTTPVDLVTAESLKDAAATAASNDYPRLKANRDRVEVAGASISLRLVAR